MDVAEAGRESHRREVCGGLVETAEMKEDFASQLSTKPVEQGEADPLGEVERLHRCRKRLPVVTPRELELAEPEPRRAFGEHALAHYGAFERGVELGSRRGQVALGQADLAQVQVRLRLRVDGQILFVGLFERALGAPARLRQVSE